MRLEINFEVGLILSLLDSLHSDNSIRPVRCATVHDSFTSHCKPIRIPGRATLLHMRHFVNVYELILWTSCADVPVLDVILVDWLVRLLESARTSAEVCMMIHWLNLREAIALRCSAIEGRDCLSRSLRGTWCPLIIRPKHGSAAVLVVRAVGLLTA